MPVTTPSIKVDAVRRRGANVVLKGDAFDQASEYANAFVEEHGATYLHPFDDSSVIAGQGTVGVEVARRRAPGRLRLYPAAAVACFRVWRSISSTSGQTYKLLVLNRRMLPAPSRQEKTAACNPDEVGLFADGRAVARVGEETHRVISQYVDEIITATTDEMCAAAKIFRRYRAIADPRVRCLRGYEIVHKRARIRGQVGHCRIKRC